MKVLIIILVITQKQIKRLCYVKWLFIEKTIRKLKSSGKIFNAVYTFVIFKFGKLAVSIDKHLQRPDCLKSSLSKLPFSSFDNLLINKHLAILCILSLNQQTVYISALINPSTSKYGFINDFYTHKYKIPMILSNTSRILEVFDGKPREYAQITHIA